MPATKRPKPAQSKGRGRPPRTTAHPVPPEGAIFYRIAEAATLLRVHEDTVRRYIYGTDDTPPTLDSVRLDGRILIPKSAFDAFVLARTSKAGTTKVSRKAAKRFGIER